MGSSLQNLSEVLAEPKLPVSDVGVIIGRFQTPELHEAHRAVIQYVQDRHRRVYILLGCGPVPCTHRNPLDFSTRAAMIRSYFPRIDCIPISDLPSDEAWSRQVDNLVSGLAGSMSVILYGGSDSFIPSYSGRYRALELYVRARNPDVRATQARELAAVEARDSSDFRAGVIHGIYRQFVNPLCTVDIAPCRVVHGEPYILMGKRATEDRYRFLGGFVDPNERLEEAAARELKEEAGLSAHPDSMIFLGSFLIDDWRYKGEKKNIITTLWGFKSIREEFALAGDDIAAVSWRPVSGLSEDQVVPAHEQLRRVVVGSCFWGRE